MLKINFEILQHKYLTRNYLKKAFTSTQKIYLTNIRLVNLLLYFHARFEPFNNIMAKYLVSLNITYISRLL